jgi:hypothetical protein
MNHVLSEHAPFSAGAGAISLHIFSNLKPKEISHVQGLNNIGSLWARNSHD